MHFSSVLTEHLSGQLLFILSLNHLPQTVKSPKVKRHIARSQKLKWQSDRKQNLGIVKTMRIHWSQSFQLRTP